MAWYNFWNKKTEQRQITYEDVYGHGLGFSNLIKGGEMIPAVSLSAVFAAIEIIANSIAELPFNVKTQQDNKNTIVRNHHLYHIFDNCLQTKYMFFKMLVTDMLLYGDGIAYIERAQDGTPVNLIYCAHGDVTIHYNKLKRELYYIIPSVRRGKIEPIDVIHLIKNSNDGVQGRGILSYANRTISLASYTEKAALDYFSSGCHVAGILSTTSPRLTEEQRNSIRQAWQQSHGKNGTGMAILEAGMSYQAISGNSKDSQLLETRLFNIQDVARFFSINPVLLGDLSHSSYSTIEASLLEFVTHTLYPYITLIENELKRKLIKPSEKNLYIDLDAGFILKSDKNSQANYLSTLVSNGIMTRNEAREQLGLNAMEGADELIIPFTNIAQNTVGNNNDDTDDSNSSSNPTTDNDKNNK